MTAAQLADDAGAHEPRHRVAALPPGRSLAIAERGTAFVRDFGVDTPGTTPVILLHGWAATSDLNWFTSYDTVGATRRVVAMDHRGHGRGITSNERFRLADCADDTAALLRTLGIDRAIVVGYSMGGAVAQLLWRRHPSVVAGLVLCATAPTFKDSTRERMMFAAMSPTAALARAMPGPVRRNAALRIMTGRPDRDIRQWALAEVANHRWVRVLEAGHEIGAFDSRGWIGAIDVPTAVVMTLDDDVVSPRRQQMIAKAVPHASLHLVPGGHAVVIDDPGRFVPALERAVASVEASLGKLR